MDKNSVRCLINSISRYIHLVSCQSLRPIPSHKDYLKIVGSLKLLKPLLDEAADYKIALDESLYKECEELDVAINEAREFLEAWRPKISKIICIIQSERLLMKIQRPFLEVFRALEILLRSSPSSSSLSDDQHCVQELKYLELEEISGLIEEALRLQSKGTVPCSDHLIKIAELLGLTSSPELLKEKMALEEERMNAQVNEKEGQSDQINNIMDLFSHIRSCMVKLDHLKTIDGVPIPPYFRCPLSLELMVDPVIVASGQTYERGSIQKWLDHGLTFCPKTHQKLSHKNLIPNYTVKALIANWCDEHNVRLPDACECTDRTSFSPLNQKTPRYSIPIDGFRSPHDDSPSRSSREVGNGLQKRRVNVPSQVNDILSAHRSRDTVKLDQFPVTSDSALNYESPQDFIHTDSFSSSHSNSPSGSVREFGNGLEKQRVNTSSRFDEEVSKSRAAVNFDHYLISSAPPLNYASPPQDFICTDSFRSSQSNSPSRSPKDVENGFEKQRANTSSCVGGEVFDVHKSRETAKSGPVSPQKPYVHIRSDSVTSSISSVDNMPPTASTEVSGVYDKNEKANKFSGEITSEHPTDLEFSPRLSGTEFQSPKTPSNGSCNNPRTSALLISGSGSDDLTNTFHVEKLVEDLKSQSQEVQTTAAAELRLLAKHDMENRITIRRCGAITPLVSLLYSEVKETQAHAVTALLNLSINEDNKAMIAEAGAIEPLIHVLKSGDAQAKENSAAALFSLSVLEEYKAKIGRSGAVKPLVDLLSSGTLRGKKDAATALFNLSIFHENKARIVQAGAVKYLVEMMDPTTGMVDKAIALLANLSTISEGQSAVARAGGIPMLVEVVETGSQRGKENAASILLQLCLNSTKYCMLVLQEGAVPPLVALSQSGTPRAKEKAQQLLSHFRSQREGASGKKK